MSSPRVNTEVALAYVGVIVPDEPRFHGPAFSRAGLMFQEGLLGGLAASGLPPDAIFGFEPTPAFPRGSRLLGRSGRFITRTGLPMRLVSFVNVQPFKWLTIGLATLLLIVGWSCRRRGQRRVIYCVNLTTPPGIFVWLAARLTRSKAVVSVLDVFRPGALVPDTWGRRFDFALQRWLLPRFDGIMVVSRATAEDLVPGRKVCHIDAGLSPELFDRSGGDVAERPAGVFRIVLSGSLERYNGVQLAIAAMQHLPASYQLVIAGRGSLAELARDAAARDTRIIFRGFLDFSALLDLYGSADLLLNVRLTREMDTRYFFPSKLMELLASGTPVLSTCPGQLEEEYGHALYLLRDETPEALASRIMEIASLDPAGRREMGQRGRAFVLREKTWARQAGKLARYIRTEVLREAP